MFDVLCMMWDVLCIMYDVLCLFFCIERDAYYYHASSNNVINGYLFAEKHPSQQHDKDEAGAFKHISSADFDVFEYLLPAYRISSHNSNRTDQAKAIGNGQKLMLRSILCEDCHASIKQVYANQYAIFRYCFHNHQ